jgi:hypothetical protein
MTRFNFKEACLLDASGELGPDARRELAAYLRQNPDAREEYLDICAQFDLLQALPPVELAPADNSAIPARLKANLHAAALARKRKKQAVTRRQLIASALAGLTSAAAAVLVIASLGGMGGDHTWQARDREQVARIDAALTRFAPERDATASAYDQMVTDVEASLRQLQTYSPTLAQVHDGNMDSLLDALASVSQDWDDFALSDPPDPVGTGATFPTGAPAFDQP